MNQWSRKDAKAHFNEVLNAARLAPQAVMDGNETTAVVVGPEEYTRLTGGKPASPKSVMYKGREMTLVELLLAMPTKEGFEIERVDIIEPRDIEF